MCVVWERRAYGRKEERKREGYPSWQPLKGPLLLSVTELGVERCVLIGRVEQKERDKERRVP